MKKQLRKTEKQLETTTSTPERARGRPKARNQPASAAEAPQLPTIPPYPDGNTGDSKEKPETSHEPKGPRGRPRKTQPEHDVPHDGNSSVAYWMSQPVGYLRIQAFRRGLQPHQAIRFNKKPWTKPEYQAWMKEWLANEAKKKKRSLNMN